MPIYNLYKARVIGIETNDNNKHEILVTPTEVPGEYPVKRRANPPTFMPTSQTGSGVTSLPDIGQLCLVAESDDELKVHIVSYLNPDGFTPFGDLSAENLDKGGLNIKIGGLNKSVLSMDRGGRVRIYSNHFSSFELDGASKSVSIQGGSVKLGFISGGYETNYVSEDINSGETEVIFHQQTYPRSYENPGFSDADNFTMESPMKPSPLDNYVDKAIIRAGSIINHANPSDILKHVYQIETRQSTFGNAIDKDTITCLRLGYQDAHQKYGVDDQYPGGTLIDWTAKRNHPTDFTSFVWRVGKYEGDVAGSEPTQGELYRLQIYSDKTDGIYGSPTINPVGDGKGYHYEYNDNRFGQQYSESFGLLTSRNADDGIAGSQYRFHVHNSDLSFSQVIGGNSIFWEEIKQSDYLSVIDFNTDMLSHIVTLEDTTVENISSIDSHIVRYSNSNAVSLVEMTENGVILSLSKDNDTQIIINDQEITISTQKMTLKLSDQEGLTLNGTSLVYSNFIEWFNKYTKTLTVGNMGTPTPLFPAAQAEHDSLYSQSFDTASGFKTAD